MITSNTYFAGFHTIKEEPTKSIFPLFYLIKNSEKGDKKILVFKPFVIFILFFVFEGTL